MASVAYTDRGGRIGFCHDRAIPDGVIVFARHRSIEDLVQIVSPRTRRGYEGQLLVPGIPEADSTEDARAALDQWRDWAFGKFTISNGVALITDDAPAKLEETA